MASTSETGNAKNVANFQVLISSVKGFGVKYNPSKNALKIPELNAVLAASKAALNDVIVTNTAYNNKVNERVTEFKEIKALATRLVNALQTTEASAEKVADAKGFNKKIQGTRAKKPSTSNDPAEAAPKTISTSQQSFDQLIQHLAGLTAVLESESSYTPNETALKVETLKAQITMLTAKNDAVADAYAAVSNSRISRDNTLHEAENGLTVIAAEVKKYVKSIDGASSPEFAQIKGIEFKGRRS